MVMDLRRMRTFGNLITFEWKSKSNSMEKTTNITFVDRASFRGRQRGPGWLTKQSPPRPE